MFWHDGKPKRMSVSVIVCEAFHGPRPTPEHKAAHNDGVPWHNHKDNLRWATQKENLADMVRHGTNGRKLTNEQVAYIRTTYKPHHNGKSLAAELNVSLNTIMQVVKQHTWRNL